MTAKSKSARRSAPACPFPMAMQTLQILSRDCLNAKKKRRTGDEDGSHDIAPSVFQNDRKGLCSALRSSIVEICNVLNFYRSEGADVLGRRYEHSGSDVIHVSDGIDVEQIWWQIQRKFSGAIFCINEKTIDEDHNESIERSEPPCSPTGRRKKDSSNARELEEVLGQYEDRNGTNQKKSAKSGRDKHYVFGKPGIDEKDEEEDASEHHQSAPDASSMSQTSAANSDEEDLAHHLMYGTENSDDSEDNEGKPLDDELRRRFESKNEDGDDIADIARDVEHALSVYQQTQRDMNEQIAQQEEILMREKKHWTLTGEVGAAERPKDALLDETLDAEFVVQEPPECTEEVTLSLEECIRKRIRDQQFDNPTRRAALTKPSDVASHTRPDPHEQERSKTSLVDLYEKEYMEKLKKMAYDRMDANGGKQVSKELSQEEKDELKTLEMWRTVSAHLDALSNAFYTPKLTFESAQDLRVRASQAGAAAGAVSIEDRGAAATLLANRNGIVDQKTTRASQGNTTNASSRHCAIGTPELTSTERKRLRRGKKEASKKKRKEKESTEECNRKGSEDRHGKLAARVKRQEQIRMSKLLPADLAKRSASTSQKTVVTRRTGSKSHILRK